MQNQWRTIIRNPPRVPKIPQKDKNLWGTFTENLPCVPNSQFMGNNSKNRSCVYSNLKQLNILWLPQHLLPQSIRSHTCCNSGSLYVLLFISAEIQNRSLLCYSISAAIQDCSLLCYSNRLRFRIAYCYVIHIDCHTGFLPVLLLPCLPSYLLLSVEKMKILSLPIL